MGPARPQVNLSPAPSPNDSPALRTGVRWEGPKEGKNDPKREKKNNTERKMAKKNEHTDASLIECIVR